MLLIGNGRLITRDNGLFFENGAVWLQGKRSGRLHKSKVITGTPDHAIAGHGRLDCYA